MGARIGEMPCLNPSCGCKDVAVSVTAHGTWQTTCHKCQFSTFGKVGTKWRRDMEKIVTLDTEEPTEKPAPIEPVKPVAKPAPIEPVKRTNSVFSLGDLK